MFIFCIDEIVNKDQEIDFIILEKERLKVNEAVNFWRNLKLKGWKEMKTKIIKNLKVSNISQNTK